MIKATFFVVLAATSSLAAPGAPTPPPAAPTSVEAFVGVTGGVGAVTVGHPLLQGLFSAPSLGLTFGIQFRKVFIFSAEVSSVTRYVSKGPKGDGIYRAATYASCTSCESAPGGYLQSGNVVYPSVGPRIDFSPFGETSPFVSLSGGYVFTQGVIGAESGGYVAGRAGFRWRFAPRIEATLEGGYQAAWLATSTMRNAFGELLLRAYF